MHIIFFEFLETHFWKEDFEIIGILDKMATLHKSDFVKSNAAIYKLIQHRIFLDLALVIGPTEHAMDPLMVHVDSHHSPSL